MTRRKPSRGVCSYCGRVLAKSGMSRHLKSCKKRQAAIAAADQNEGPEENIYHLRLQDTWGGIYWLHLEMVGSAPLEELDMYLRAIWLECCGHLSAFYIGTAWIGPELSMGDKAEDVFQVGQKIIHLYDFGTTSETEIKVLEVRRGKPTTPHPIALMARNQPPEMTCMYCDRPASWLCMECVHEDDESGLLCDVHVESHPHSNYGEPVPIVNSPRLGMCGYIGPADPPY